MTDVPFPAPAVATETAVVVTVPAAEAAVGGHRRRYDIAASWGVPAHVTVVYPFVDPADVDDTVLTRLADAVVSVPAFACTFARTAWFDDDVLWLAPDPVDGFHALTAAVVRRFPRHQPYGGRFAEVVPHLTIGERRRATSAQLRAAEHAVTAELPIETVVEHAVLLAGTDQPDSWHEIRRLPLGTGRGPM